MDLVKIMWISDLRENSVLNGCLLVFFFFFLISGFVFLLFLFKKHLNLNSCDF